MSNTNRMDIEKGQLRWIPKTVMFKGKLYKAPLDLTAYIVGNVLIEMLKERWRGR